MNPGNDGEWITVIGARTHNLRDIDVRIPRNRIVAFTGISGSGKSSLALDTVHAEAQLRYMEGLSPFVRQYVTPKDRPQVERIDNLGVTLAVDQRKLNRNARSTIGTMTGIDSYLSLLFSRLPRFAAHAGAELTSGAAFDRHSPEGACPACQGMGGHLRADESLIVTHPELPLKEGGSPWFEKLISPEQAAIPSLAQAWDVDITRPWRELPERFRDALIHGTGDEPIAVSINIPNKNSTAAWTYSNNSPLRGALAEVERLFAAATTENAKQRYLPFMRNERCAVCDGTGFGEIARTVTLAGRTFLAVIEEPVSRLRPWVGEVEADLEPGQREIGQALLPEIAARLRLLEQLGLAHVQLSRPAPSLSGGELQRARLASQLSTALTGIIFVLDEPSSGLHPADKEPLFEILAGLRDAGNSVLMVEHDPELVALADWVIDIGPGAGSEGGELVGSGPPAELADNPRSRTGPFLTGQRRRVTRTPRPVDDRTDWLELADVRVHNVAVDLVRFPLNRLTCITGVSGSGKSTLLRDALAAAAIVAKGGSAAEEYAGRPGGRLLNPEVIGWASIVDQDPIGRTPRSNPATYTKAFDIIRQLYAGTEEAVAAGLTPAAFSFNSDIGRCPVCKGYGRRLVDMHFLPDVWATCEACDGRRFQAPVLAVRYQGLAVDELLQKTVTDSLKILPGPPTLTAILTALQGVGLGYLQLGQSATELSGGEAQRLKLATAITRGSRGRGLIMLDEPVTGLHPADVQVMIDALDRLLDDGNTVVVAEHDLYLAANADWVVDVGPGAGAAGGRLTAAGPAAEVAEGDGPTARYLRKILRRS